VLSCISDGDILFLWRALLYYVRVFPFDRPTNYNEMLNKIGAFTFVEALVLSWYAARASNTIASVLDAYKIPVKVFSIEFPFLYVLTAAAIALAARIPKLHNKISDLLGIRQTFDVYRILIPLAGAVGIAVDRRFSDTLKATRKQALQRTFYRYASFEEPKISKALVLSAIDTWTWYWILSELLCLLCVAAGLLLVFRAFDAASLLLALLFILTLLFSTVHRVCGKNADYQIEELVSDPERVRELQEEFGRLRRKNGNASNLDNS
jgi:hypothetical protein